MNLSRFWFLLLFINVFLNLEPIQEWAEKYAAKNEVITKEICTHTQWVDPKKKEQQEELFAYFATIGLSSSLEFQGCDIISNPKEKIENSPRVPFSYLKKTILLKNFWSSWTRGRAPPRFYLI